ncbi:MAG: vitamin B12 dependent-methionine synthase activation domain-containing protein [Phycisphaerae bacterium]|jgi:hypothetical protein
MNDIIQFTLEEASPGRDEILANQGIPPGTVLRGDVAAVYDTALARLAELSRPAGVVAEITLAEFAELYTGEGRNEHATPVGDMMERITHVALFAATCGAEVSQEIGRCFGTRELAVGAMLDSAASALADRLGELLQQRFRHALAERGVLLAGDGVLRYSPGYCGWHISGQKRLFARLNPSRIGITLRDSFLMEPLKSVSGAILAGPRDMHQIDMAYPACPYCKTQGCRERIRSLLTE